MKDQLYSISKFTIRDFVDRFEMHLTQLMKESEGVHGKKSKAYELTEKDWIEATGKRKYRNYQLFSQSWCQLKRRGSFGPSKRRSGGVAKRSEWDSKFNWLF